MKITDFLSEKDIDAALASAAEPDSFHYKLFLRTAGFNRLTPDQICQVFSIIDRNGSGSLGSADLTLFLKNFKVSARHLTENEVKEMMKNGDPKNHDMIGLCEFQAMVKSSESQN